MKKITFAIVAVIVSGLVASQATAGTCSRTVGGITFKKYCTGPIAGWTYSPGTRDRKYVPWDDVLYDEKNVESIVLASIGPNIYKLKDITVSKEGHLYMIYKDSSPVTEKKVNSQNFPNWVLNLPDEELKKYLQEEVFSSFEFTRSGGTAMYKFKPVLPAAKAGDNQSVRPGDKVTLDGSGSSNPCYYIKTGDKLEQCTLVYQWSLVSKPPNSTATLSQSETAKPTFDADRAGDYVLKLVVSYSWEDPCKGVIKKSPAGKKVMIKSPASEVKISAKSK